MQCNVQWIKTMFNAGFSAYSPCNETFKLVRNRTNKSMELRAFVDEICVPAQEPHNFFYSVFSCYFYFFHPFATLPCAYIIHIQCLLFAIVLSVGLLYIEACSETWKGEIWLLIMFVEHREHLRFRQVGRNWGSDVVKYSYHFIKIGSLLTCRIILVRFFLSKRIALLTYTLTGNVQ